MTVIGDDLVDLGDAETDAGEQHPRFDARVFTLSELEQIAAAGDPRRQRWVFWAAKEAAYKAARQMNPHVAFVPRRFVVTLQADSRARVQHDRTSFAVDLERRRELVHAVAQLEKGPRRDDGACDYTGLLLAGVASIATAVAFRDRQATAPAPGAPSRIARRLVVEAVARSLRMPARQLRVVRQGRVPQLVHQGGRLDAALSLSHHGRFAGFACLLSHAAIGGTGRIP